LSVGKEWKTIVGIEDNLLKLGNYAENEVVMPISDFLLRNYPKRICKCCVSTLVVVGFPGAPNREIPGHLCWSPRGDGDCLEGLWCREGNLIPWVVQTDGEESWVVGIVVGVTSLCFSGF
jgi:hypothetical protein